LPTAQCPAAVYREREGKGEKEKGRENPVKSVFIPGHE